MNILIYFIILIVLLLLIYFFQRAIIQYFSLISFLVFKTNKIGIYFYFLFFLPGVILHELSHLFTASVLGVRTGQISIFPHKAERQEGGESWMLGEVKSAQTDVLRNSLIGLAPMVVGAVALVVISQWIRKIVIPVEITIGWEEFLAFYLIVVFSNTMFISKEDRTTLWALPIVLIILGVLAWVLTGSRLWTFSQGYLLQIVQILDLGLGLTVLIDFIFILPLFLVSQILLRLRR